MDIFEFNSSELKVSFVDYGEPYYPEPKKSVWKKRGSLKLSGNKLTIDWDGTNEMGAIHDTATITALLNGDIKVKVGDETSVWKNVKNVTQCKGLEFNKE